MLQHAYGTEEEMTELRCPSCGGDLEPDKQNHNMAKCRQCHALYAIQWNASEEAVPERIAYEPIQKKEPKKTGWEPYGWKRGVALVILFFVLMGIMCGPKIYRRYQMDHGGITAEMQSEQEETGKQ